MAVVSEVITEFSFKGSVKPLSNYRDKLSGSITSTLKFAAVTGAAVAAVGYMVQSTLAGVDSQAQLAKTIGVSVEAIQELSFAASVTGSNGAAMVSTLSNLSSKIGEAALKGSDDFSRLGLSVYSSNGEMKKSDELLGDIAGKFKSMSAAEQSSYADALGIDKSLLQLLNKTGGELETLKEKARSLGVVTTEESEGVVKYNDSLTTLSYGLKAVAIQASLGLAPAIGIVADSFTDFLVENKSLIKDGLTKLMEVLTSAVQFFGRIWAVIKTVIEATIGWKGVIILLAGALALLFPFAAVFTGIALVVDDLTAAFMGADSVIISYLDKMNMTGTAVAAAGVAIMFLAKRALAALAASLVNVVIPAIIGMGKALSANPVGAIITGIALAAGLIYDNWGGIAEFFTEMWATITAAIPDFDTLIPDFARGLFDSDSTVNVESGALRSPESGGVVNNSSSQASAVNQDIQINVSSEGAARQISSELRNEIITVSDQLGRGGR